jgi:hypothetical protein
MIRYYGFYSEVHRGKMHKIGIVPSHPLVLGEEQATFFIKYPYNLVIRVKIRPMKVFTARA